MIEVSLSLIEQDATKISPKIRLHWDMRRTVLISFCECEIFCRLIDKIYYYLSSLDYSNVISILLSKTLNNLVFTLPLTECSILSKPRYNCNELKVAMKI